jgi:hypothetical protein
MDRGIGNPSSNDCQPNGIATTYGPARSGNLPGRALIIPGDAQVFTHGDSGM